MDFSHPGGEDRLGKFQKWGYPEIIQVMDVVKHHRAGDPPFQETPKYSF